MFSGSGITERNILLVIILIDPADGVSGTFKKSKACISASGKLSLNKIKTTSLEQLNIDDSLDQLLSLVYTGGTCLSRG